MPNKRGGKNRPGKSLAGIFVFTLELLHRETCSVVSCFLSLLSLWGKP